MLAGERGGTRYGDGIREPVRFADGSFATAGVIH